MESEARGQKQMTMFELPAVSGKGEVAPVSMTELGERGDRQTSPARADGRRASRCSPSSLPWRNAATDHKRAWLCSHKTVGH